MSKYDDIIYLKHHQSSKHPHMSLYERAAQFAPFAALNGHSDAIKETARITDNKVDIDENMKAEIDRKINYLYTIIDELPLITVEYFIPDGYKKGGKYVFASGRLKKIDFSDKTLLFSDNSIISVFDIIDIKGDVFNDLFFY